MWDDNIENNLILSQFLTIRICYSFEPRIRFAMETFYFRHAVFKYRCIAYIYGGRFYPTEFHVSCLWRLRSLRYIRAVNAGMPGAPH